MSNAPRRASCPTLSACPPRFAVLASLAPTARSRARTAPGLRVRARQGLSVGGTRSRRCTLRLTGGFTCRLGARKQSPPAASISPPAGRGSCTRVENPRSGPIVLATVRNANADARGLETRATGCQKPALRADRPRAFEFEQDKACRSGERAATGALCGSRVASRAVWERESKVRRRRAFHRRQAGAAARGLKTRGPGPTAAVHSHGIDRSSTL